MTKPTQPAPKRPRPPSRATVVRRLYLAIDRNLSQLEVSMAKDEPASPADHERETRALHTIIRNVEKVSELETGKRKPATAKRTTGRDRLTDDPELLRLEIAERILRLRDRRAPGAAGTGGGAPSG
jgi:hypothetical protein